MIGESPCFPTVVAAVLNDDEMTADLRLILMKIQSTFLILSERPTVLVP